MLNYILLNEAYMQVNTCKSTYFIYEYDMLTFANNNFFLDILQDSTIFT